MAEEDIRDGDVHLDPPIPRATICRARVRDAASLTRSVCLRQQHHVAGVFALVKPSQVGHFQQFKEPIPGSLGGHPGWIVVIAARPVAVCSIVPGAVPTALKTLTRWLPPQGVFLSPAQGELQSDRLRAHSPPT